MSKNSELHIQIQDELFNVVRQVEEGELSHLDALIIMHQNREEAEKTLAIIKEFSSNNLNEIANKAEEYKGKYNGYEIKSVNGKKLYKYDDIAEVTELEESVSAIKEKFKSAFENYQKGNQLTETVDGVLHWIDGDGFLHPFPELNYGASYITVKKLK